MPARSKAQQKAAGAALAAKRGETGVRELKGASRQMVRSMTKKELEELASTPRKGLPNRVGQAERIGTRSKGKTATKARAERNKHLLPSRRIPRG